MQVITVKIEKPDDANFILGQTHFIKSVEDIHEALVGAVPGGIVASDVMSTAAIGSPRCVVAGRSGEWVDGQRSRSRTGGGGERSAGADGGHEVAKHLVTHAQLQSPW